MTVWHSFGSLGAVRTDSDRDSFHTGFVYTKGNAAAFGLPRFLCWSVSVVPFVAVEFVNAMETHRAAVAVLCAHRAYLLLGLVAMVAALRGGSCAWVAVHAIAPPLVVEL